MKVVFLGTGTSQGVPVIGCGCWACSSEDKKDKRNRSSILVCGDNTHVVIDCGPDFREQALRVGLRSLDAVVLTHEHNDHVIGLDDTRPLMFRKTEPRMPVYGLPRVLGQVKERFAYGFEENNSYPGAPKFEARPVEAYQHFTIGDLTLYPIAVRHGTLDILGYRIGNFAYLTDVKELDYQAMSHLLELEVLVINALHRKEHHSHLNLDQAIALAQKLGPKKTFFTHMSHYMGRHEEVSKHLPPSIFLAYDHMELVF